MTSAELVARTRAGLAARRRREVPAGPLVRAAVLVPIVDRGEPCLVFARRTEEVAHHRGQVSFPGGVIDPTDASALAAALREAEEEIGLPPAAVEPLGALDDTETVATRFVITPWVGLARPPGAWRPDGREIATVFEVPLAALLDPATCRVEHWDREGVRRAVYFYEWGGQTIWGATARILRAYLDLIADPVAP